MLDGDQVDGDQVDTSVTDNWCSVCAPQAMLKNMVHTVNYLFTNCPIDCRVEMASTASPWLKPVYVGKILTKSKQIYANKQDATVDRAAIGRTDV